MHWTEIVALALALSLDAFAVSLAAGTAGYITDRRAAFRLAFHFGLFQFLMPVLGWALGTTIEPAIAAFDHWIAFVLLTVVGGSMIRGSIRPDPETRAGDPSRGVALILLAIATSLDALAVGLSLAMVRVNIWFPCISIGIITAAMSVLAIVGGRRVGPSLGGRARLAGGVVLVLIGLRILVAHLP